MSAWRDRPVKTLLVDLDGTLLASLDPMVRLEFITRGLWRMSRHGGVRAALQGLRAVTRAVERPDTVPEEERVLTNAERGARAFARSTGLSIEESDRFLREEVASIFPKLERYFYPVRGAREFIDWASERYDLILATNPVWPIAQVELRLRWSGIDAGKFRSITHSGRMHACKPSVDYYQELLEQEGLDARDCALVGDDVRKDLPATRAGISVFVLKSGRKMPVIAGHGGTANAAAGSFEDFRLLLQGEGGRP